MLKSINSSLDLDQQKLEEINPADNKINDLLIKVDDLIDETIQWKEGVVSTDQDKGYPMDFKSGVNGINNKIGILEEESLKRQNIELQERALENLNKEDFMSSQNNMNEIQENDLETIIVNLKGEINKLNNDIVNVKENKSIVSNKINQKLRLKQGAPNYYQIDLFMRLFQILDKNEKNILIESIIEDLIKLKDNEIKRYIILLLITILNDLKDDQRICKELIRLFKDDDWLIRLTLVKTLYRTDNDELIERFKKPLKSLLDDIDLDVREASEQILRKISL